MRLSLSGAIDEIRTRAGMSGSSNYHFLADDDIKSFINSSWSELYDILVQKYGDYYFATAAGLQTTANTQTVALPTDCYKIISLDWLASSGSTTNFRTLSRATMNDRQQGYPPYPATPNSPYGPALEYLPQGTNLLFVPTPTTAEHLRLWYVPLPTLFSASAQSTEMYTWSEYVILDSAIKCRLAQDDDDKAQILLMQKSALVKRIEAASANRDVGKPVQIMSYGSGYRAFNRRV